MNSFKCDSCKKSKSYTIQGKVIAYCSVGNWEGYPVLHKKEKDPWQNCPDFEGVTTVKQNKK